MASTPPGRLRAASSCTRRTAATVIATILIGGGSEAGAPPLKGPIFTIRWRDQPLADMFVTIGTTMPQNKPDSLTPQIVIDIISFLLKSNEMPPGSAELPPDLEALKSVFMEYRP